MPHTSSAAQQQDECHGVCSSAVQKALVCEVLGEVGSTVLSPLGFAVATMPGPKPTTATGWASAGPSAQAACGPRRAFALMQSLGL